MGGEWVAEVAQYSKKLTRVRLLPASLFLLAVGRVRDPNCQEASDSAAALEAALPASSLPSRVTLLKSKLYRLALL